MKKTKRVFLAGVAAAMVATLATGCSGAADNGADSTDDKSVGVIIWSTEDGLGAATKRILDAAGEALDIDLSYKTGDYDTESQVRAAENFVAAGVDGILVVPLIEDAIPKIGKLAEDASIPFGLMYRRIDDEAIKAQVEQNPFYLGYTVEDEEAAGEQLLTTLAEADSKEVGALYFAPGATVVDRRHTGVEQGFANGVANKVGEVILPQTQTPITSLKVQTT